MVREPCLPLSYPLRPPTKFSTRVKGHVPYVPKVSHPATSPDSQTLHKHLISNDQLQLQQTHWIDQKWQTMLLFQINAVLLNFLWTMFTTLIIIINVSWSSDHHIRVMGHVTLKTGVMHKNKLHFTLYSHRKLLLNWNLQIVQIVK